MQGLERVATYWPQRTAITMLTLGKMGLTAHGFGRRRESIHITIGYPA